ncbi:MULTISPECIES: DUF6507 family protein [Auritidibacter]|uniref:Uncharacterized protein n=1 Tax=Auritidibacter ignavus TaxID=678932 RepID=A0AAJ6DFC6_9MICC|nr:MULTISPECIES: hypothetical protein [Auritidibacter]PXA82483.1 hypothetical protein DCC26_00010 [Auritidibacter sp. NML120779]AXR74054.1 hypothetical protein DCC27_006785 [Auritidibacter sp. NML130574]NIH71827.1 hypothetical protein [Auritidibacter ignavus]PXA76248.1 hypothetical protein DCC24_07850 [Auritidibacter sp. NML100628]RMX21191.1 hypothetical protein DYI20_11960 [Auritidibacter ignavus]
MFYEIHPEAARSTISQTSSKIPEIESANDSLESQASSLGGQLSYSPQTSGALNGDVSQAFQSAGEALVSMLQNNISATTEAVNEYGNGDQAMCVAADGALQQVNVTDMPGVR